MTWVRIDDGAPHHDKLMSVGPEAAWLWVATLAHANRQTTDGVISPAALVAAYPWRTWTRRRLLQLAEELVRVGLWEQREGGGWRIHDYAEYQGQAMREAVRARRDQEAARKREWRGRLHDVGVGGARGLPRGGGVAPLNSPLIGAARTAGAGSSPQRDSARSGAHAEDTEPDTLLLSAHDLVDVLRARCQSSITLVGASDAAVIAALGRRLAELESARPITRSQIEILADWYEAGSMRWRGTRVSLHELARTPDRLAAHIENAIRWDAQGRPALDRDHRSLAPHVEAQPHVSEALHALSCDPLAMLEVRKVR